MIGVAPCASEQTLPMVGNQIALGIQLLEELKASIPGFSSGGLATGNACGMDGKDCLVGSAGITGEGDGVLVLILLQIGPVGGDVLDDVLVHMEGEHAIVIAIPKPSASLALSGMVSQVATL